MCASVLPDSGRVERGTGFHPQPERCRVLFVIGKILFPALLLVLIFQTLLGEKFSTVFGAVLAELLEMKTEDIEKKLAAKWVKDDSFVPLKTVPKVNELKLMSIEPDQETLAEKDRQEKLLEIPGVKISDITVREYPLGEAAAHLVGYVQNVTAEDLEEHAGEGYTSNSVIGKSGMEGLFEKEYFDFTS